MGIFDALKGIFGYPTNQEKRNSDVIIQQAPPVNNFKKPDWANDDEDTDDELEFRNPQSQFTFSVFSNPIEIHQYFENQIDRMAKHFEEALSKDSFFSSSGHGLIDSFFSPPSFFHQEHLQNPALLSPKIFEEKNESLRDKCLKPKSKIQSTHRLEDSDLDGEFNNGQVNLFKPSESPQIYSHNTPQVFSSQVFTKFIRRPDGSTEEVRTKQIGDKSYTKIIRTDAEGKQHVHEDIVNIDENKIKDFQKNIGDVQMPKLDFRDWFKF